jgi:hypothetical protein
MVPKKHDPYISMPTVTVSQHIKTRADALEKSPFEGDVQLLRVECHIYFPVRPYSPFFAKVKS